MRQGRLHQAFTGHEVTRSLDVHGDLRDREFLNHSHIRDSSWNADQRNQSAISKSLNEGTQLGHIIKIAKQNQQIIKSTYAQPQPWLPQKRVSNKKSNKESQKNVSQKQDEEIKMSNFSKLRGEFEVKGSPYKEKVVGNEQQVRQGFKLLEKQNLNGYSAYHNIGYHEDIKDTINVQQFRPSSSSKQNNYIASASYNQGLSHLIAPQIKQENANGSIGITILNNYLNQTINIDKDSRRSVASKSRESSRIQNGLSNFHSKEDQLKTIYGQKNVSQSSQGAYSQGLLSSSPFLSSKSYSVNTNRQLWKEEFGGVKSATGQRRATKESNNNISQENYYNINLVNNLDISLPQDKGNTTNKLKKTERLKSGGWRGQNSRISNVESSIQNNFLGLNLNKEQQQQAQQSQQYSDKLSVNHQNVKSIIPSYNKTNYKFSKNIAPNGKGRSFTIDVDKSDDYLSKSGGRYSQLDNKKQNKAAQSLERNPDQNNKDLLNRNKLNNIVSNLIQQANLNLIGNQGSLKDHSNPTNMLINQTANFKTKQEIEKLKQEQIKQQTQKGNQGENQNKKELKEVQMRIAERTKKGVLASNPQKINQDSVLVVENLGQIKDQYLFGVFDGHGTLGHKVSQFIKQQLPNRMLGDEKLLKQNPKAALFNAVGQTNYHLAMSDIDCTFSGSTLVSVLIQGTNIYSANAGDSRATIGRQVNPQFANNVSKSSDYQYQFYSPAQYSYEAKPLTRDHKPGLPDEAERILKQGGRIDSFRDKQGNRLGPLRVWLKNENYPGLAMSRSIGDDAATSVGVTWEPEIFHFNLEFEDKFMIVASDGVWEFIDDDQIVDMIAPFYEKGDIEGACDIVMEESYARWTSEDDSVIDDTSLILIFFHQKTETDTPILSPKANVLKNEKIQLGNNYC